MIKRLRSRFIKIATLAVAAVLLLLCLIVNVANFVSVDSGLTQMLTMISDNKGQIPKGGHRQDKPADGSAPADKDPGASAAKGDGPQDREPKRDMNPEALFHPLFCPAV